ncbi:MAG: hypothetical protein ACPL3C_08850, partial [Pyrobaculum sp.]
DVDGRRMRVRVEEVEAWREKSKKAEHLVVRIKAKVFEGNSEVAVEKEARFFKSGGRIYGYVNIAEEEREADYLRTAAVLKALAIEKWKLPRQKGELKQIQLTGGALDALIRLEPVHRAVTR